MPAQPSLCSASQKNEYGRPASWQEQFLTFIRKLAMTQSGSTNSRAEIDSEEIICDVEHEGWRYLLVRAPIPSDARLQLSPREQEIVRMVAEGHPNKVIAAVLNISSWTVGTHLRRIFAKLGVGSRAAMVARCPEIANTIMLRYPAAKGAWNMSSSPIAGRQSKWP
jgi:DNA-binding CsgD family transcriptional regulator